MKKTKLKTNIIIVFSLLAGAVGSWYLSGAGTETDTAAGADEQGVISADRIVSGYTAFTEILTELGISERIVAATRSDARALDVTSIGSHMNPDLEAIVSSEPDLVLVSSRKPQFVEVLKNRLAGSGAVVVDAHPGTVDEVFAFIARIGALCDCKKQAQELIERNLKLLAPVDRAVAGIPADERPVVFLEVRGAPSLLTCGRDSIAYDVIRRAGGRPLCSFKGGVVRIDVESVVNGEPDLYIQQFGAMNRNPAPISEHAVLKNLSCVRTGAVLRIDEKLISRPGTHTAEAVVRIYRELYNGKQKQ